MAKRKVVSKTAPKQSWYQKNKHLLIPAGIGGLVAWIFSDSFQLGLLVFIGVWIGCVFGGSMLKKK